LNGEHLTDQFFNMFAFDNGIRFPENVQAHVQDSFEKARSYYGKATACAKGNVEVLEEAIGATQQSAKTLGEKVLSNAQANAEAFFNAAQAIARAKTLPELFRLQTEFVQQQLSAASKQGKELFELSSKHTQRSFEQLNSAVAKSFEHLNMAD
jgi:phasin family protein